MPSVGYGGGGGSGGGGLQQVEVASPLIGTGRSGSPVALPAGSVGDLLHRGETAWGAQQLASVLVGYASLADLTVRNSHFWSTQYHGAIHNDGDSALFQFLTAANAAVNLNGDVSAVTKLRIAVQQFDSGNFVDANTYDVAAVLGALRSGDTVRISPYTSNSGAPDAANYVVFTASGAPVRAGSGSTGYYDIPGTAAKTGSPANNANSFYEVQVAESRVYILARHILNIVELIQGEAVEHPDGALARQAGKIVHWTLGDMRYHLIGPSEFALPLLSSYALVTGLPDTGGEVSIGLLVGTIRNLNIAWGSTADEDHLARYLVPGRRLRILKGTDTWICQIPANETVNKNTIANGGYGFPVQTVTGTAPTGTGSVEVDILGDLAHWSDAVSVIRAVAQASDFKFPTELAVAKALALYVKLSDLEARTDDFYSSYLSAFLADTSDTRINFGVTSDTSGAPTAANQYSTPDDIPDGTTVTLMLGQQQNADSDPNAALAYKAVPATDLEVDDVLYLHSQAPLDVDNYVKFTVTEAAVAVGSGHGAYWYVRATTSKVGNNFANNDDWYSFRDTVPTALNLDIPASAITGLRIAPNMLSTTNEPSATLTALRYDPTSQLLTWVDPSA